VFEAGTIREGFNREVYLNWSLTRRRDMEGGADMQVPQRDIGEESPV
jgi:hypothetical protein